MSEYSLAPYLSTLYQRHGRGPVNYDCYGLVRAVRHEIFSKPLMPAYVEVEPDNKLQLTRAASDAVANHISRCEAVPGAIAMAWRGRVCVHVGVVVVADGRRWIMETDEPTGPQLVSLRSFQSRYPRVEFYD